MFGKQEPEVLVVGAGPVGLFTSICLRNESLRVQTIDKERRPASHSYALALHPDSLRLLEAEGIAPESLDPSLSVDTVAFYDESGQQASLQLNQLPGPHSHICVLRQSALEQRLERELSERKGSVDWRHRLAGWEARTGELIADIEKLDDISTGYPIAMAECEVVDRFQRHPKFLVGADGHRSIVRRHQSRHLLEMGETELFGVFEFECGDDAPHEIRVVLAPDSTNVFWPLPDGRCRWSFQLDWDPHDEELRYKSRLAVQVGEDYFPQLTESMLLDLLAERAPWFELPVGIITWSVLARFDRRLVDRFGEARVWMAGDAVHLAGPVGTQSMNVGLREGRDLARLIAQHEHGQASLTQFEEWGRQRTAEWRMLLGVEGAQPGAGASDWVRQNWTRIHACIPASGRDLQQLGEQLGLEIALDATTGLQT